MEKTTVPIPTRTLVLGMAHEDGSIHIDEVMPVAEACGQSAEQVRSCLRRLVAEGSLARNSAKVYEATASGLALLGADIERTRIAYAQDAAGAGWDRNWRLVAFAVPESRRSARDGLRDHLVMLGGAAIQGGLYVSPHPWHKDVRAEVDRLGLSELVTYAVTDDLEVAGERDTRRIVAKLWPVENLAARYQSFVDDYSPMLATLHELDRRHQALPDSVFLPAALSMAVAFRECFEIDPLLPPELLPRPWPGRVARDLLIKSRRLALSLREKQGRPSLFRLFDATVEVLP